MESEMGHVEAILNERQAREMRPGVATMIKTILFHVHEDESLEARLQTALALARACSSHVHLLSITPLEAYTVVDTYGGTFISGQIVQALEEESAKVRARLEKQLAIEDVSWDYEETTAQVVVQLIRNSALSDLVIAGREPRLREFSRTGVGLIGELLHRGRAPLLIPGDDGGTFDPFAPAVIAWNGSAEAATAVRAALGLLKMASAVHVVRFLEEKERAFPDTRLLEYLPRQGIHAALDTSETSRSGLTADLLKYSALKGAGYIVLGGYSHSRAGEFLFGGITRDLLWKCATTLVMAH
jgi:nucleotide-binding universal stress UspA family protein